MIRLLQTAPLVMATLLAPQTARSQQNQPPKNWHDVFGVPMALFDGASLDGWRVVGGASFAVEDGVIEATATEGGGWLVSEHAYADFVLELEIEVTLGSPGVQVRSDLAADGEGRPRGVQVELGSALRPGQWNALRVECAADSIRAFVNGVPVADTVDSTVLSGRVALEAREGTHARVRDVRLTDRGASFWQPIFDGHTFDGWEARGGGEWTVEDGAFVGRHVAGEAEHGHLVSKRSYGDFTLRLEYLAEEGNSGLYFRVGLTDAPPRVAGSQAEIDARKDTGGLYETGGRGWVVRPGADQVARWFRPGEWNSMTVSARAGHVAVDVNSVRTAELRDEDGGRTGPFALQLHGGEDVLMRFRGIELLQSGDRRLKRESLRTLDSYHPWDPPQDLEAWEERVKALRRQIEIAGGVYPMPSLLWYPDEYGAIDRGDYTVSRVILHGVRNVPPRPDARPSEPVIGLAFGANLYVPKGEGPFPAVLSPHGHWEGGRFSERGDEEARDLVESGEERYFNAAKYHLQARCAQLARMGCIVLQYDMVGYGDTKQISHESGVSSVEAMLRLQNLHGLQLVDSFMALTFLSGDGRVDKTRIGMTGASGGGTQTFFTSSIEHARVAAAFPAVMVSTVMQGGCRCENAPFLRYGTGNVEFAALTAPRALGLTGADDWTRDIAQHGFPELKQLWEAYGVPAKTECRVWPEYGHNYNVHAREMMYGFMNEHLKLGLTEPIIERDFDPIGPAQLSVWDAQHPPWTAPEQDVLAYIADIDDRMLDLLFFRLGYDRLLVFRSVIQKALRFMLYTDLPTPQEVDSRVVSDTTEAGRRVVKLVLSRAGEHEQVPALLLVPDGWNGVVVVGVSGEGKRGFFGESGRLDVEGRILLSNKAALLLIDCILTGELPGAEPARALPVDEERHQRDPAYTWCYNKTLIAQRVNDILTAVGYAKGIEGARYVNLRGLDQAGPWTILARAILGEREIGRVAADWSWTFADIESMDDPNMLPGGLRYGDLDYFAAACSPGELVLVGKTGVPDVAHKAYISRETPNNILSLPANEPKLLMDWLAGDPKEIPEPPELPTPQRPGSPLLPTGGGEQDGEGASGASGG